MNCDPSAELLSALLDGEVDPADRAEIEAHMDRCDGCRDGFRSLRAVKHAVARLPSREDPPGAVRAKVENLRFKTSEQFGVRTARLALSFVAVGCLLASAILLRRGSSLNQPLVEQLVLDHERSIPEAKPPELSSSDPQEVRRFFAGRVPFTPVAPRLPEAQLVGGRLCQLEGRHVQLLFYFCEGRGQTLSVFVSDRQPGEDGCREYRGCHVCSRRFGKLTVLAVGKVPEQALEKLLRETTL